MNRSKVVKIKPSRRLKRKGRDRTELRVIKKIHRNGNTGGAVRIPVDYLKRLGWEIGKTEVYVTLLDDGKVVIEPAKIPVKAAS